MQGQDFGIKIDYGTPGPILEPNQDEYIGHDRNRTPQQWNQDKTSIAEVKLNKRCSMPYVNINIYVEAVKGQAVEIRGVWKTRTWSIRNRTKSLQSWNHTRTM